MAGIDWHTHPHQFVFVDLVAAAFGHGFHQTYDVDTSLEGMVAGNQPHVAPADNEQLFGSPDQITIDQCLEGARAVDAWQGVPLERQGLFPRSRSNQEDLRFDEHVALTIAQNPDFPVAKHGQRRAVQPDIDVGVGAHLVL